VVSERGKKGSYGLRITGGGPGGLRGLFLVAIISVTRPRPVALGGVYLELSDLEEEVGAVLLERPCHLHRRARRTGCQRRG
jgi:hypothetical protein